MQSQNVYARFAVGEINKITKKHSFRSFVNQERSLERVTDIKTKVRRLQNENFANHSSKLKFSLQEYAPSLEMERRETFKLR